MTDQRAQTILSVDDATPIASALPGAWHGRIAVLSNPVPRDEVSVPISRHAPPTDEQLFDDPTDGTKKYWLPRYRLAEETVSGRSRYRLRLFERAGEWRLALGLVPVPPPGLEQAARDHPMLAHELEIELSYNVLGAPHSRKSVTFQEQTGNADGIDAELILSGLGQRDEVFEALSEPVRASRLTVRRRVQVAVQEQVETADVAEAGAIFQPLRPDRPLIPVPVQPIHPVKPIFPGRPKKLATPKLTFAGTERYTVRNKPFVRYRLSVTNWKDYSTEHFKPSPDLPPCGSNRKAARTWVDIIDSGTKKRIYGFCALDKPAALTRLWFARAADQTPPAEVRIKLTDRRAKVSRMSNSVKVEKAPKPDPLFRVISASIDQVAEPSPFAFSRDLHGYIFNDLAAGGEPASPGGLIQHRASFRDAVHSYFQDAAERGIFYYLPDDFRIARQDGANRYPFMTLRVHAPEGSTTDAEATLDYVAVPVTDPARLDAARASLAARARIDPERVRLERYITSDVRFIVQRPTASGRVDEERPGGALLLQGPLFDTLTMPLTEFQMAFDAMLGRTASHFGGRVEIDIEGHDTETRRFVADAGGLAGPVLHVAADETVDGLKITLTNVIESPVALGEPVFRATRGEERTEFRPSRRVSGEAELAPDEQAEYSAPPPSLPGTGAMQVSLASGATVRPDEAAVLDAIFDRSMTVFFRDVEVLASESLFEPIPDRPKDQIESIFVDFEGGETIELTAATPRKTARVDYPFADVVLRKQLPDEYRYTVTVLRKGGSHHSDAEPRQDDAEKLFLRVDR